MVAGEYFTVSESIRKQYADEPLLQSHIDRISVALRMFEQSLLGRNIKVNFSTIHVVEVPR